MDIREFFKDTKYKFFFKIFAIVAIIFFYMIHTNNFEICDSVKSYQCTGDLLQFENLSEISKEKICSSPDSENCCMEDYGNNTQCYMGVLEQSIFAGYTGSVLMLVAELFFFIALVIFKIFPFFTRYIIYGGSIVGEAGYAAKMSAEIFSKAIYFITPIILVLIFLALYRNLPYFIWV